MKIVLSVIISCLLFVRPAVGQTDYDKAGDILNKMEENRNKVERYECVFETLIYESEKSRQRDYEFYIKDGLPEEEAKKILNQVYSYSINHLSLDNKGCGRIETIVEEVDAKGNLTGQREYKTIETWDGKNSVLYNETPGNVHAIIRNKPSLSLTDSYMQPWRTFGGNFCDFLKSALEANQKVDVEKQEDGKYRIEFLYPEDSKTIGVIDPNQGYSVIIQETYYKGTPQGMCKAQFKQVQPGIWFPVSGEFILGSTTDPLSTDTMTIKELKINDPNFYDGLYQVDFLEGTRIRHTGKPGVRYTWKDGKCVDVAGKQFDLDEIGPPPERTGKPLPVLKVLGIDLSPADVNDKAFLVCFFDMEQRPSRNCILQLSEIAQELRAKDITIVAAQASKVEQVKLDDWVRENNIDFPVGMVRQDEEKTRFNWGVRSLPWLILADRKHVVVAEGFSIDGLNVEITKTIDTEKTTELQNLKSFLDAQTIYDVWKVNYSHIDSMKIKTLEKVVHAENISDHVLFNHFEKVIDGKRFHVRHSISEAGFGDKGSIVEMSFDGNISKRYISISNAGSIHKGLFNTSEAMGNPVKEYLHLDTVEIIPETTSERWDESRYKIVEIFHKEFPEGVPRFAYTFIVFKKLGKQIRVLPELESVAGEPCHVLEIGSYQKYWFAHEKSMLLMRHILDNGNYCLEEEFLKVASVDTDVGPFWYPSEMTRKTKHGDEVLHTKLIVKEFVPYIKVSPETFDVNFPVGARVIDQTSGKSYILGSSSEPKIPDSLISQSLPDLNDVGVKLQADTIKNKNILVCFFDMEQRPSRNCILQMGKRAQELKAKDVTIVAVQASKIEQAKLDDWVRENNMDFPVGMVRGDEEKTLFNWGIRSLPWLILADRKHVVVAEGFSIDELNVEITKTIDTEKTTELQNLKSFLDAQALVDGWEASYCHIDSLKVNCTQILVNEKGQHPITKSRRSVRFVHHERIQNGTKFLSRFTRTEQGFDKGPYVINSFDGSISREYISSDSSGVICRGLLNRSTESMNMLAEFLRTYPAYSSSPASEKEPSWEVERNQQYPQGIPVFLSEYNGALALGDLRVRVRPYLEYVAGEACHVLELYLIGRNKAFWFAHEKGMLPMKTMYVATPDIAPGYKVTREVKEIAGAKTEKGILWYPYVIMEESTSGLYYSCTLKTTVNEFVPYFKAPPETFSYEFPKGTRVWDKIRNLKYMVGSSGSVVPKQLRGESLPGLDEFVIDLTTADTNDMRILVCFFDMEQEPSRNCILQLSKRAQGLKTKDIAIVAVQASKIERAKLDDWVKENDIKFPVEMIEADEEEIRYIWGVHFLPWMILTDRQHIIRSQGFRIDDVEERFIGK